MKNKKNKNSERKRLNGKVSSRQSFIWICLQLVTLLKPVSSNSSNRFPMSSRPDNNSQLLETMKENNADCLSTPQTSTPFLSTLTRELILIFVFSQREPLKESGNSVLTSMSEERQSLKLKNGTGILNNRTLSLVKMVKEFLVSLNTISLRTSIQRITSLTWKNKTLNSNNNALSEFFH